MERFVNVSKTKMIGKRRIILSCLLVLLLTSVYMYLRSRWEDSIRTTFKKELYQPDMTNRPITQNVISDAISILSESDKSKVKQCARNQRVQVKPLNRVCSPNMTFRAANRSNHLTALVSLPGSGNTWIRQIIEEATGIYTGSVYCDHILKKAGFLGEHVTSTSVLTIKTHAMHSKLMKDSNKEYDSVILLIRNPYEAIIAEANRRWTQNHTDTAEMTAFRNYTSWRGLVYTSARGWANTAKSCLQRDKPLLVVRYEDLKSNQLNQLKRILAFLKVSVTDEKIDCVVNTNQNQFKRNHKEKNYDEYYYTEELKESISEVIHKTRPLLEEFGVIPYEPI